MKKIYVLSTLLAGIGLTGCGDESDNRSLPTGSPESPNVEQTVPEEILGEIPGYTKIELPANGEETVKGENEFAFSLFPDVMASQGYMNTVFSPFNTYMHLAMLSNGDTGEAGNEIVSLLGGSEGNVTREDINSYGSLMLRYLPVADDCARFNMGSSVWHTLRMHPDFMQEVGRIFNTGDFETSAATLEGMEAINEWVCRTTYGLIPSLLDSPLPRDPEFITASAFIGRWSPMEEFQPSATEKDLFRNLDGTRESVEFMRRMKAGDCYSHDGMEGAVIPFGGGNFSFLIFMPREGEDFKDFIGSLNPDRVAALFNSGKTVMLDLRMPKFEVVSQISPADVLRGKHLEHYTRDGLNMILAEGNYREQAFHLQTATLSIDENGVRAAAVDFSGPSSAGPRDLENVTLDFNRPFAYMIRENSTGTILFLGAVTNF